jgi:hypothetical protein
MLSVLLGLLMLGCELSCRAWVFELTLSGILRQLILCTDSLIIRLRCGSLVFENSRDLEDLIVFDGVFELALLVLVAVGLEGE